MPLAELLVLCTAPSGDCDFRSEVSSGFPALNISLPCLLFSFPFCNHLMHITHFDAYHPFRPTFLPLPADPFSPPTKSIYRPSCSLAAILLLASAGSHECPLPSCTFSARHLQVTVNFGRGLQVVFLHSVTSLVSAPSTSVFHASLAAWQFAITSMMIHILQLSSHCLRIQPLHPHRASGQPPLVVFQKDPAVAGCACVCVGNF